MNLDNASHHAGVGGATDSRLEPIPEGNYVRVIELLKQFHFVVNHLFVPLDVLL